MIDVSIIIVNYNTKKLLKDCITSIYRNTKDIQFEIIVSDNGSIDGSTEMIKNDFPQVILIKNTKNIGFGAANNRGLAIARGKYVFYLNSDTVLLNNAAKFFFDFWENFHNPYLLGAIGANLLDENGKITYSYGNFFKFSDDVLFFIKKYLRLILLSIGIKKHSRNNPSIKKFVGEVDIIIGADLFMKNDDFARFDEYFFLYHEEADLEYQLLLNKKLRILIDGPKIIHFQGKSESQIIHNKEFRNYCSFSKINDYISKVKFYKKNYNYYIYVFILKFLILLIWLFPPLIPYTRKYIRELLLV
ncbi:MAG: glycosyltransferase [Bacteroidales bacterium]|jgi:GT2 family glycosyltransferase|nr:glycosyltransferase [Bacteroidales bacterium]